MACYPGIWLDTVAIGANLWVKRPGLSCMCVRLTLGVNIGSVLQSYMHVTHVDDMVSSKLC
jgi:hypothetical protein